MNPNECGELYPKGYLDLVDKVSDDLMDSCENPESPSEEEVELYFEGLKHDVLEAVKRKV